MEQNQATTQAKNIPPPKPKITSPDELLKDSIEIYKKGFLNIIKILLVPLAGMALLALVSGAFFLISPALKDPSIARTVIYLVLILFGIASFIFFIYITLIAKVGMYVLINAFSSPDEKKFKEVFWEAKTYIWQFVVVGILVGLLVILWSILFIIPGIIFAVYYSFAAWTLVCENRKSYSALKRSKELVKNYWWPVAGRFMFIGVIYFLIFIVLSIPNFFLNQDSVLSMVWSVVVNIVIAVVGPIAMIYNYLMYKDLARINGVVATKNN